MTVFVLGDEMKKTLNKAIILTLLICLPAFAYDPPEIIGYIGGQPPDTIRFGSDFCCAGDQNGDGFDDLLVGHNPQCSGYNPPNLNQVKLYHGNERMNDEPDFIFQRDIEFLRLGYSFTYLGYIIPNHPSYIFMYMLTFQDEWGHSPNPFMEFFQANDSLDSEPDIEMNIPFDYDYVGNLGRRNRPTDINGDGINDFISWFREAGDLKLGIYYGGENFDSIPEVKITIDTVDFGLNYSSGYDINGDGFDDILLRGDFRENRYLRYWYSIFLGGSPMDTIPVLEFAYDHFDNMTMDYGYSLLPDVNGDGCDDWGLHYWIRDPDRDGYLIFFGSDEPDLEPDLVLEGHRRLWVDDGDITGGDFNGDGYGDIVTCMSAFNPENAEVHIHFGSRWMDGVADIYIRPDEEYGEEYNVLGYQAGAVGDYNGDGIDDFVVLQRRAQRFASKLAIFAGNRDWRVNVDENQSPGMEELTLSVSPNPFNDILHISYSIPTTGFVNLAVYDIKGRYLDCILNHTAKAGKNTVDWRKDGLASGVYFIVLETSGQRLIDKFIYLP